MLPMVSQCVSTMMRGRGRRRFVHCRLGQGERGLVLTWIVMGVLYLVALMEEEDLQKTQNKKKKKNDDNEKNEKNDNEKTKNEGRKLI